MRGIPTFDSGLARAAVVEELPIDVGFVWFADQHFVFFRYLTAWHRSEGWAAGRMAADTFA